LFALPPETAHDAVFAALRLAGPLARWVVGLGCGDPDPRLALEVAGLRLQGPVGLAAGLDKEGVLARLWPRLGFGAVELGTVTALAQPGNPKPRLFRFPDERALVNRMGFNNSGSQALADRLRTVTGPGRPGLPVPLGVNLGKSKVTPLDEAAADYATSAGRVAGLCDYLVINVSSPNTPGLRELQDRAHLEGILAAVVAQAQGRPVFVKLAPDLSDEALDEAVSVAEGGGAAGIIATNTTTARYGLPDVGPGGLSGRPLAARSLAVVRHVAARTALPVIAVGGIGDAAGVLRAFAAGAAATQLYTAFIYGGPRTVHAINRGLVATLEAHGLPDVAALKAACLAGELPIP
jgi:dihydroorotate dehydrogenase